MNGMCASLIFFLVLMGFRNSCILEFIAFYPCSHTHTHTHTLFVFARNGVPNSDAKKTDSWLQGIQIPSHMRICSLLIFILQTIK